MASRPWEAIRVSTPNKVYLIAMAESAMQKFVFLTDLHFGFERRNGHKVPLHDPRALTVALAFCKDFKPDVVICGGDMLDAGCISHHNKGKPGRTEGLRLMDDASGCRDSLITPLEELKAKKYIYHLGNHDGSWLQDFEEDHPAFEGMINVERLMSLDGRWDIIPQGGYYNLGKLTFVHGDTLTGEACAKKAVTDYERSIRFGHFHSYSAFTKCSPIDVKLGKTGISVPCLCRKDMNYGKGKANKWVQGFNYGVVYSDGSFNDSVAIITNGKSWVNGKVYNA